MKRSLASMSLAIVGVFVSIPIVIVVGGLGLYFLFGGVAAFVTGVLSALGSVHPSESPLTLMAIAPAMAATGAVALAGVGGYFWLVATLIGTLGRR